MNNNRMIRSIASQPAKTRLTERKRKAVLQAAVVEFVSNGFESTTMDQIALTAKVSKRTVYNHFPSKDELFTAIVDELVARADTLEEFTFDDNKPLDRQLIRHSLAIVRFLCDVELQNLARVVFSRTMTRPEYATCLTERTGSLEQRVASWFSAAHDGGQLRIESPRQTAQQWMALLLSHAFWPVLTGVKKKPSDKEQRAYVKQCVAMFLRSHLP